VAARFCTTSPAEHVESLYVAKEEASVPVIAWEYKKISVMRSILLTDNTTETVDLGGVRSKDVGPDLRSSARGRMRSSNRQKQNKLIVFGEYRKYSSRSQEDTDATIL